MKMSKSKLKIVQAVLELIVAAVVFGTSCFAWFASNKKATVEGMSVQVKCDADLHFCDTVTAVRHYNSGAILTNIYEVSSGALKLKSTTFDANGSEEPDPTAEISDDFLFANMLPGEYVDITVNVYTTGTEKAFELCLTDFGADTKNEDNQTDNTFSFFKTSNGTKENDTIKYGVLPAFKWGIVKSVTETKDEETGIKSFSTVFEKDMEYFHSDFVEYAKTSDTEIDNGKTYYTKNDDETYTVVTSPSADNISSYYEAKNLFEYYWDGTTQNTDEDYTVVIYSGEWSEGNSEDNPVEITFRIQTDFVEYFEFLGENTGSDKWNYSNYLSAKKLTIGTFELCSAQESEQGGDS